MQLRRLDSLTIGARFMRKEVADVVFVLDALEYPLFGRQPDYSRTPAAVYHSLAHPNTHIRWTGAMEVIPLD